MKEQGMAGGFHILEDGEAEVCLETAQVIDYGVHALGAETLWARTRGAGVTVAVLDTGWATHPDLDANVTAREGEQDVNGHGTHVAGIVGAIDNNCGVVGVAPGCRLLLLQVLPGNALSIAAGLRRAQVLGADVVNMSIGAYEDAPELAEAVREVSAAGVVLVAAAGNDPSRVCYPAAYKEVIAASALNADGSRASFAPLVENHVALPGVNILSTWTGSQYACLSGTSQAAPLLSGSIALMLALLKPEKTNVHAAVAQELSWACRDGQGALYCPRLDLL